MNQTEIQSWGFERPRAAHQLVGGRGTGLWDAALVGDGAKALSDPHLLDHLAIDLKRGDRVYVGVYEDHIAWRDERRTMVAEVLVLEVEQPKDDKNTGRVTFKVLSQHQLGEQPLRITHEAANG